MKIVITCSGQKNGESLFYNGNSIDFVSNVDEVDNNTERVLYFHPDDLIPNDSKTWRDLIEEENSSNQYNLNLLSAYQLYAPDIYNSLFEEYEDKLFIFSAGWGIIQAKYKLPKYDITFSQKNDIPKSAKRKKNDIRFKDFNQLQNDAETILFIAGKDYLLPFCELTKNLNSVKIIVFTNSDVLQNNPYLQNHNFIFYHYKTDIESNWYYEFAKKLVKKEINDFMDENCAIEFEISNLNDLDKLEKEKIINKYLPLNYQ